MKQLMLRHAFQFVAAFQSLFAKATISAELSGFLDRLGSRAESCWSRLEKLGKGRLVAQVFAASRERLRELALPVHSEDPRSFVFPHSLNAV
jgi:hypothetical protein